MRIEFSNGEYPDRRLWLDLPIIDDQNWIKTTSKLARLTAPGQESATLKISDVESHIPNLKGYILSDNGETSISQLSLLAQKISHMGGINLGKFSGALDIEQIENINDVHKIADNLDDYELFPDVTTDKELGAYLVESGDVEIPRDMLKYVDFARIGAEYYSDHSCAYADNCLVVRKDDAGMNRAVVFDLQITSEFHEDEGMPPIRLSLPASPEKLESVAERLRLYGSGIDGCRVVERKCPIDYLDGLLPESTDIVSLNSLAIEVEHLSQTDKQLYTLCAVLEAERPDTIGRALEVTHRLDDYEITKVASPYDYGYHVLYESDLKKRDIEIGEEVKDFIDFDKYGEWRMGEDGARQTDFGMVRRLSEPFEQEEIMSMGGLSQ
jgi:hypothetical protein